jgi:hypothetical protein
MPESVGPPSNSLGILFIFQVGSGISKVHGWCIPTAQEIECSGGHVMQYMLSNPVMLLTYRSISICPLLNKVSLLLYSESMQAG